MIAGAFGSALSDITSPWTYFTLVTFSVKRFKGLIIGIIARNIGSKTRGYIISSISIIVGMLVMISGYL